MGWFSDVMRVMSPISNVWDPLGIHEEDTEGADPEDVAKQREETSTIGNQYLAQLVPGSAEYNELQSEIQRQVSQVGGGRPTQADIRAFGEEIVKRQQARVARGEPITPLEARTNVAAGKLREAVQPVDFEQDIFRVLRGEAPQTQAGRMFLESTQYQPEEQDIFRQLRGEGAPTTPLGGLAGDIFGRARAPVGDIESFDRFKTTLPERLELVRGQVENQFARRGITPTSGLALEGLGRAGVETAIGEEAAARDAYLRAAALRQQELGNREQAIGQSFDLFNVGEQLQARRQAAGGQLLGEGERLRERQIGLEDQLVNLQLGRETNLTGLLGQQTNRRLDSQEAMLARERAYGNQATLRAEAQEEARRQELRKLAALAGSAGLGGLTAGMFPAVAAASGITGGGFSRFGQGALLSATGGQVGLPNFGRGTSLVDLLGGQRQDFSTSGDISAGLSRQSPMGDDWLLSEYDRRRRRV